MPAPKLITPKQISMKDRPDLSERWVEQQIAENPSILGLGEVEVRGRQRNQPRAGRLDLLLEDTESKKRFEVELQLGKTDESHIIRAIEYWDLEKKQHRQHDHCAVLVAEDITSRFLNVINLLNGIIPFIAIQMRAYEINEGIALTFTKVVDELELGEDDSTVIVKGITTRADYEGSIPKQILEMVDTLYAMLKEKDSEYELNYTKYYIGLTRSGLVNNFLQFRPKQNFLKLTFKCAQSPDLEKEMENAGFDSMGYDQKWREYTIRIAHKDFNAHKNILADVIDKAYQYANEE